MAPGGLDELKSADANVDGPVMRHNDLTQETDQ